MWEQNDYSRKSAGMSVRAGGIEISAPAQSGDHLMLNIPVLTAVGVNVTKLDRTASGAQYEFSVAMLASSLFS